jgi:manganese transport protein
VPGYTIVTVAVTIVATMILLAGFDPIKVTVIALIFAAAALPLTFYPMLIVGRDEHYMGDSANGPVATTFGWLYFAIITLIALVALPVVIVTGGAL